MLTVAALAFVVNIGGAVFNWLFQRVGRVGTQIFIFALAVLGALYYTYSAEIPGLQNFVTVTAMIFSLAVTFYEVILSRFQIFSGPPSQG